MKWQTPEVTTAVVETQAPAWMEYAHGIELPEAQELIVRHMEQDPASRTASVFSRVPLDAILAQPGCVGVRMYFGMNPDGTRCLVLVGVDSEKNDLPGVLAERGLPCPPECPMDSILDW